MATDADRMNADEPNRDDVTPEQDEAFAQGIAEALAWVPMPDLSGHDD